MFPVRVLRTSNCLFKILDLGISRLCLVLDRIKFLFPFLVGPVMIELCHGYLVDKGILRELCVPAPMPSIP